MTNEKLDELERLLEEAKATRAAYREACGVGVIGDSAAVLVAMMNTDGPEFKAMRAATDALNRAAINALPELVAMGRRVEALRAAAQEQLDYMDMCNDKGDLERNLRAALAALKGPTT